MEPAFLSKAQTLPPPAPAGYQRLGYQRMAKRRALVMERIEGARQRALQKLKQRVSGAWGGNSQSTPLLSERLKRGPERSWGEPGLHPGSQVCMGAGRRQHACPGTRPARHQAGHSLPQVKALEPQAGGADGQAGSSEGGSGSADADKDEVSIFGSRSGEGEEGQDGQQKGGQ
jgi:hypothetical protein